MKKYFNKIHYSCNLNIIDKIFKLVLLFFSYFYLIGVYTRNFLYKSNFFKKTKLSAYVISIGNLTTGGTGKTPITAEIANYIQNTLKKKTTVLSRGYGGKYPSKKTNIVSDGENVFSTPSLSGDEPYWLAVKLKNIPVITGKNRIKSGQYAIDNFETEVLLLDDGFQHIMLERDLNILVIDSKKKFGNNIVLPAGALREPASEIKRADKIIIVNKDPLNRAHEQECQEFLSEVKEKYNKPAYLCRFKNGGIYNIQTLAKLSDSAQNIYAFTGIAQPEFFFNYLKEQNLNPVITKEFSDHHFYTHDDIKNIIKEADNLNLQYIITTEKDAVKLTSFIENDSRFYTLKLDLELDLENLLQPNF